MNVADLFPPDDLFEMIEAGYVSRRAHPTEPLEILNYTHRCQYDRAWNPVTRQCRGLIVDAADGDVVARPFPKFFNHGEPDCAELDLAAPAVVTDKLDGSLGVLYPTHSGYAIATRGSFESEQALHATVVWEDKYAGYFEPLPWETYLFEIVYGANRIVVDYGDLDDLILLAVLDTETGRDAGMPNDWPGPTVEEFEYDTLAEALAAEPRPNREGLVVYFPETLARLKIKQDDYVALHRILTGTNARNVWEYAAVKACRDLISDPKHWATYLGIDPARAAELLEVGDDWLETAGLPDEFFGWVRVTVAEADARVQDFLADAAELLWRARHVKDRRARFELVAGSAAQKEIMRLADAATVEDLDLAAARLTLRAWREATPAPTAPFARSEEIA